MRRVQGGEDSGLLAPASKLRPRILPKPPPEPEADDAGCDHAHAPLDPGFAGARRVPKGKGSRYWPWRLLKARTFGEPTTACPECCGELRLRALVQDPQSIQRFLTHLGLLALPHLGQRVRPFSAAQSCRRGRSKYLEALQALFPETVLVACPRLGPYRTRD